MSPAAHGSWLFGLTHDRVVTGSAPGRPAAVAGVLRGVGRLPLTEYQLGVLDGEPAAVLARDPGEDDLVFILDTRTRTRPPSRDRLGCT